MPSKQIGEKTNIVLADHLSCTGCSACYSSCPQKAISMIEDEYGFLYPKIDEGFCVKCGLCENVCPIVTNRKTKTNNLDVYASVASENSVLLRSSSGGIFYLIALKIIENGGIVYGCALNEKMEAYHLRIISKEELFMLQGSKYIQSNLSNVFQTIKTDLQNGECVLFSGTPCQVNGLKAFLRKEYDNLFTIDLVCHGVPSYSFFKEYLDWYQQKYKAVINNYQFRDKKQTNFGCVSRIDYTTHNGKKNTLMCKYHPKFYFYYYYMTGAIFRESCYKCNCLPDNRESDLTLGDFWGADEIYKTIDVSLGTSVVVVHTKKGSMLLENLAATFIKSDIEKATLKNKSLIIPVVRSEKRNSILDAFKQGGESVYKYCKKDIGAKQLLYNFKNLIPVKFKRKILNLFKRKS